jgi:hypothetical protein
MRRRIERLQRCIDELEAFDPQKVQKRYREPEVMRLEAMIDEALSAAFGHGTRGPSSNGTILLGNDQLAKVRAKQNGSANEFCKAENAHKH